MRIGNDDAFIELVLADDQLLPDVAVNATIARSGFGGAVDEVWIEQGIALDFVKQLELIARDAGTKAELLNLSSGTDSNPLSLTIRKADSLGHLIVDATVRKVVFNLGATDVISTSICFELERELMSTVIVDLKKIFAR
jgi:hypothetical protein